MENYTKPGAQAPYYDDYDPSKGYTAILFKPSVAVQARELTQMQSIQQDQLSAVTGYMFTDGTVISGAKITTSYSQPRMKVKVLDTNNNAVNFLSLVGKKFIGQTSQQIIEVTKVDATTRYILFSYLGSELVDEENFISYNEAVPTYFTMESGTLGNALTASCSEGRIYVDGYIVYVPKADVVVDIKASRTDTFNIGFMIDRSIVTSATDGTLNDPAVGSYNYSAPGADRYKIGIALTSYSDGGVNDIDEFKKNFVIQIIIKNNVLIKKQTTDPNSTIMDVLAKRTYDESGSYTVTPWKVQLEENKENDSKYIVSVQPGEGYINGYYISNEVSVDIENTKPRTTTEKTTNSAYVKDTCYTFAKYNSETGILEAKKFPTFLSFETVEVMTGEAGTGNVIGECTVTSAYKEGTKMYVYLTNTSSVQNAFTGARSIRSKSSPTARYFNLYINADNNAEFYGSDSPRIFRTPYSMLSEINSSSIDYSFVKKYIVTSLTAGNKINLTETNENIDFPSNASGLLFIYETETGTQIDISGLSFVPDNTTSISGATITGSTITNSTSYTIVLVAKKINSSVRTKIAKTGIKTVNITSGIDSITLNHEDIIDIVSVTKNNIAINFTKLKLDDGQRDYIYDYGTITGFSSLDNYIGTYVITYRYYDHSGSGPFSANSYVNTANKNFFTDIKDIYITIPKYISSTGETYFLRDCLDFRIKKSALSSGTEFPEQRSEINYSADIYLPRTDIVWVDKNGNFGITHGIPSEKPEIPAIKDGTLNLYYLYNSAYSSYLENISTKYINNQRYTMSDINKLNTRLLNAENAISLNQLEQSAVNMQILDENGNNRYKSGIFTDNFSNFDNSDYTNKDWNCTIDAIEQSVRPLFNAENLSFIFNSTSSVNVAQKGVCVNLPYTTKVYAKNDYASGSVNVQQLLFYVWKGNAKLTPSVDTWVNDLGQFVVSTTYVDTPKPPTTYRYWTTEQSFVNHNWSQDWGFGAGHGKTVTTTYRQELLYTSSWVLSNSYISMESQDVYMRRRSVAYSLTGMRPGMTVLAKLDKYPLTLSNTKVAADGTLTGTFTIPENVPVGTKVVKFEDTANTSSAQTNYSATGKTIWKNIYQTYIRSWSLSGAGGSTTIVSETARDYDPVAESFYVEEDSGIYIDSIDVFFKTKDTSIDVSVYIVECANGYPTDNPLPFATSTVQAKNVVLGLNTPTNFKFDSPIYLQPNTEYAFVVASSSYSYEVYISTLGKPDLNTGVGIAEQPFLGSMFMSQNARTWTAEQESDIKFRIHQCVFDTNSIGEARFDIVPYKEDFDVAMMTLAANNYILNDTKVVCSYKWNTDSTWTEYTNNSDIFLNTLKTIKTDETSLSLKFIMSTENANITPQVDLEQVYGIFTNNIVTERQNDTYYLYDCGTYISNQVNLENSSQDIRVILDAILPNNAGIDVYYKTSPYQPLYVTQSTNGSLYTDGVSPTQLIGKTCQVYYYNNSTKQLEPKTQLIVTGYEASTKKVYLRSVGVPTDFENVSSVAVNDNLYENINSNYTDILILPIVSSSNISCPSWSANTFNQGQYVRYNGFIWQSTRATIAQNTPSDLSPIWTKIYGVKTISVTKLDSEIEWRAMKRAEINSSIDTQTKFVEYTYYPEIENETEFSGFSIKISLKSRNKVDVPRIRNLRAIATV